MRLHVIDGTFELFRAHFSKRPGQTSPDGQDVKATVGVMSAVLSLIDDDVERATHLAVAFDNPIESFRNDLFLGYKTGAGMDPVLTDQFEIVEEAVRACGVTVWSMDRWEADDALATAARRWCNDVDQVRIMTPDKDLGQVVEGDRVVQVDRIRGKVINEAGVLDRNGVPPASIPDWLALVGDTADGIPGVPGFGAKTASTLLQRYGSVESIPADPETWDVKVRGAAKLSATLEAMREEVALYRELAVLVTDVPLAESLDDLRWRGAPRADFEAMSARLGGVRYQPHQWL
tara:strand:+ start:73 stop:942 length:870 start_codon:yes stop_codon:yes gene_type:complete